MSEDLNLLAADWALAGLAFLAAGVWAFLRAPWLVLRPLGLVVAYHALGAVRLARRLSWDRGIPERSAAERRRTGAGSLP